MTELGQLAFFIWVLGAAWRCQQLARFLQGEAYQDVRFLRGQWRNGLRALPWRALTLAAVSLVSNAKGVALVLLAALAIFPWPWRRKVKSPLRWTGRLWRLLVLTWGVLAVLSGVLLWQFGEQPLALTVLGSLLLVAAPLWLVLANLSIQPLEWLIRAHYRRRARALLARRKMVIVGITGSWGKTSTKHILAELLGGRRRVYATPKSYNTLMGVTLAINRDLQDNFAIDTFLVEMGAYRRGEIAEICQLVSPSIAILVDIGPQHLERFGSLAETTRAKFELVEALPADGLVAYNWDSDILRAEIARRGLPQRQIAISRDENAPPEVRLVACEVRETLAGLSCRVEDRQTGESAKLMTGLYGEHNCTNLLLACAIASEFGTDLRELAWRARHLQAVESRLQRQETAAGITILNDGYSANPLGARGALQTLGLHEGGRRLLVTPGMVELGAQEEAANQQLGVMAAQFATDVILVDEGRADPILRGLLAAGFPQERAHTVARLEEAVDWYQRELRAGDTVLFLNDLPDAR